MAEMLPDNWDWVSARLACSGVQKFTKLREFVLDNIEKRNAASPPDQPNRFQYHEFGGSGFRVFDSIVPQRRSVQFMVAGDKIMVSFQPDNGQMVFALTLDDFGECKFVDEDQPDGEPLDMWQVARRALETLFFG